MVLLSAHRCGASGQPEFENSRRGLERALGFDVEYVEFDVQRCADGTLVLRHDETVAVNGQPVRIETLTYAELLASTGELLLYEDALAMLAGRKRAHIDFKFTSPVALYLTPERTWEVGAADLARRLLGDDGFLITSVEDHSVRALRAWAQTAGHPLLIGLSLGRGLASTPWYERPRVRWGELIPTRRVADTGANLIAAHRNFARLGVARWTASRDIPLLVWTVDAPRSLRAWLSNPQVWLLTTSEPQLACRIRGELSLAGSAAH